MSTTDDLIKQILASSNTSKWTGEGFGSAEKNAADMAKILSKAGITDIKQLGVKQEIIPAMAGEWGETPEQTVNKYYNKETGQELENTYGERQTGNFFGGTFSGKGNTGYGVQFRPDGTPVFYTQGASSNDVAKIMENLGPVGNIAAATFGGPMAVAALAAASGKPIKDIAKSAALSYLGGQAGDLVSGTSGLTDILGKAGTDALSGAAKQYVASGGKTDPLQLLMGAGLNYGANTLGDALGVSDLSPAQQKMLSAALSGVAGKQSLDKILMNVAMTGAMNQGKAPGDQMTVTPNPENLEDFLASIDQYKVDQNADASGPGYYDEITGKFISDDLGGLQNPLGADTGNLDPNKQWEYNLVRPGVWADADGNEIDLTYLPNSETALTGEEIMRRAGAMPGGSNVKVPTKKAGTTPTPQNPLSPLAGLQQQAPILPSQDPFAHIKLMEELFGTDIDLTPTEGSDNTTGDNAE